jgi:hypothetical protein
VSAYGDSYDETVFHQPTGTAEDHQSLSRYCGSNFLKSFGITIFDGPRYRNGVQPVEGGIIDGSGSGGGYDADGQYRPEKG